MPTSEKTAATIEQADIAGQVRQIGRMLASYRPSHPSAGLAEPGQRISQLIAGSDANGVEPSSDSYRYGAADALASVMNALAEQMLSQSTHALLRRRQRPRVLVAIAAARRGTSQKELSAATGIQESNLSRYIRELVGVGLIEPDAPRSGAAKAWRISPWGVQALFSSLDVLGASGVPDEEIARAVRAARPLNDPSWVTKPDEVFLDVLYETRDEVYESMVAALHHEGGEPLRFSTLTDTDLAEDPVARQFHQDIFDDTSLQRSVSWLLLVTDSNRDWAEQLIDSAVGNKFLSVCVVNRLVEARPAAQVLDDRGLLYPIVKDLALPCRRDEALAAWHSTAEASRVALRNGKRLKVELIP